jgi:membrane protease YdiL (CAAX protease family)
VRLALIVLLAACGPAIHEARMSASEPPSERELDAAVRVAHASCGLGWHAVFPGIGQACLGKPREAAVLATLGAVELATGVTVAVGQSDGVKHPGAAVPLVALQDTWLYSIMDATLDLERGRRLRYVPQDTLAELALAPWNPRVLAEPDVWAGILGTTALAIGATWIFDGIDTTNTGGRPNLFGHTLSRRVGYPLAGAIGLGTFEHVAIAEETTFRGEIQSTLARSYGETHGWLWGSLVFGGVHAANAIFMSSGDRVHYLTTSVPFITIVGSWLGLSYRWHHYSLAPSVAEHFWYDFLLSAVSFALDPQHSQLSANIAFPL